MRIALITHEYPGVRPGGIGSYTVRVAATLAAAGHESHIFTLAVPSFAHVALPPGVQLHAAPDVAEQVAAGTLPEPLAAAILAGGTGLYRLAIAWLLCEQVRIVHQQTPFAVAEAPEYEALGLPLMLRPPPGLAVVTQAHLGSALVRHGNNAPALTEDHLLDALEAAALAAADGVYAATENIAGLTQRALDITRPFARIPHPVTLSPQSPSTATADGPVLFVGRLMPRKGCLVLAPAINLFLKACPAARFEVIGADTPTAPDGGSMQVWMLEALDPAVRPRAKFRGELSAAEVAQAVQRSRFTVIPSLLENFANTALDPMAAGRAVVYAGGTGLDEVVGAAGVRVDPLTPETLSDALVELYRHPARAAALAAAGRQRISDLFSPAHTIDARVRMYQEIHDQHAASASDRATTRLAALAPRHVPHLLQAFALLVGACSGSPAAMADTPADRALAALKPLADELRRPLKVWIFGAGRYTARLLAERQRFESAGHQIAGLIDDAPRFASGTHLGLSVLTRAAALERRHAGCAIDAIILSTDTQHQLFWNLTADLRQSNIPTLRLD